MYAMRALVVLQIKREFAESLDRLYHHERMAARVYRSLAERSQCSEQIRIYLRQAYLADREAHHCTVRLSLLKPSRMLRDESYLNGLRCWALSHCNATIAIHLIEWMGRREDQLLNSLFDARAFWG